jgi:hypothetical protein
MKISYGMRSELGVVAVEETVLFVPVIKKQGKC